MSVRFRLVSMLDRVVSPQFTTECQKYSTRCDSPPAKRDPAVGKGPGPPVREIEGRSDGGIITAGDPGYPGTIDDTNQAISGLDEAGGAEVGERFVDRLPAGAEQRGEGCL